MLQLHLEDLAEMVVAHGARRVGVQLPFGLRRRAREIAKTFGDRDIEVVFSGTPSYGACDVADAQMARADVDLLVHFGHSAMLPDSSIPVLYWEVVDDVDIIKTIRQHRDELRSRGRSVGLVTTVQHVHQLPSVRDYLVSEGFDARIGDASIRVSHPGQVLGCSFETATSLDVDFYLYVGTGYFHPVGISLATDRPVMYCDPYTEQCIDVTPVRDRIVRKRYAVIEKARAATHFAVVVSTRRGQYRIDEALNIKKLLREHGKTCHIIVAEAVDAALVQDFGFDAYVVAACPRIAIDDAPSFEKPVLTVTEVPLLFDDRPYQFDEIHKL
ncbi:MAG TPA: diphthamide biosynthesis enzyme Dph2 [Methanomicrobia archaeon]|nr:diphthamide biosynthesis enzyme Dph2 [Methanomicrobia archaeon]